MSPGTIVVSDTVFYFVGCFTPEMSFHRSPDSVLVLRMKDIHPGLQGSRKLARGVPKQFINVPEPLHVAAHIPFVNNITAPLRRQPKPLLLRLQLLLRFSALGNVPKHS